MSSTLSRPLSQDVMKVRILLDIYQHEQCNGRLTHEDVFRIARERQGLGTCKDSARIDFQEFDVGKPLAAYVEREYIDRIR